MTSTSARLKSCDEHRDFVAGCAPCRDRAARYERQRQLERLRGRRRLIDPTGTQRRLQALAALGWPQETLGARLGMRTADIGRISRGEPTRVRSVVAERVCQLYDELSMTPGPSTLSVQRARAKGWAPPLAWDDEAIDDPTATPTGAIRARRNPRRDVDEVAVRRAAAGEQLDLSAAERAALVALLARQGLSDALIADRVGLAARSVERIRARHGIPAAAAA